MNPDNLEPGKLSPYAQHCFKYGACGGLAIALHDASGWPIYAVTDSHNVFNGKAGGGSALHWVVKHPSGKFVDIDGLHDSETLIEEYADEADDEEAELGRSSREDAWEWYVECQEEPIPISLASTFVRPLMEILLNPSPETKSSQESSFGF